MKIKDSVNIGVVKIIPDKNDTLFTFIKGRKGEAFHIHSMRNDVDIQFGADLQEFLFPLGCEREDFICVSVHVKFIFFKSFEIDSFPEFIHSPFLMLIGSDTSQVIAFMDRYDLSYWQKVRILMEKLTHNRVLSDDKVVPISLDHVGDFFGHMSRTVSPKEIMRNGRGEKILGCFKR